MEKVDMLQNYFHGTIIRFYNGVEAKVHLVTEQGLGIKVYKERDSHFDNNPKFKKDGEYFVPFSKGYVFEILHDDGKKR